MEIIKNILFYGSLNREEYDSIREKISEENRKAVTLFAILAMLAFLATGFLSIVGNKNVSPFIYFCGAGAFIVILIINELVYKKKPMVSDVLALLFSAIVLAMGILIAYSQINERTTMLLPVLLIVALVFCYRPIYLIAILILTELVYLTLMGSAQEESLFFVNKVNTCIFCFMAIASGLQILKLKHKKFLTEQQNSILVERDILTGLYNRFSCNKALEKIVREQTTVTICAMDVNGLKKVNDSKGHLAGDELIIGAAECIKAVFGKYGKVFRIGGDEFCALVFSDINEEDIRSELNEKMKAWRGHLVDEVSVALGMARLDHDFETRVEEVIHEADVKMYAEKKKMHQQS